jgi:hypothetical protein
MLPIRDSLPQIVMAVGALFLKFELAGLGVAARCLVLSIRAVWSASN